MASEKTESLERIRQDCEVMTKAIELYRLYWDKGTPHDLQIIESWISRAAVDILSSSVKCYRALNGGSDACFSSCYEDLKKMNRPVLANGKN